MRVELKFKSLSLIMNRKKKLSPKGVGCEGLTQIQILECNHELPKKIFFEIFSKPRRGRVKVGLKFKS